MVKRAIGGGSAQKQQEPAKKITKAIKHKQTSNSSDAKNSKDSSSSNEKLEALDRERKVQELYAMLQAKKQPI